MAGFKHMARVEQEVHQVFLNARFGRPESCTDLLVEAEICPGHVLVVHHDDKHLWVTLAEDWTRLNTHTEIRLRGDQPDWDRLRRWLWDSCYEHVRSVAAAICKSLGISVAWPEPLEENGRKFFPGREPIDPTENIFEEITEGDGANHVVLGGIASGKTTLALRLALDAAKSGKTVLFASTEMTTASLTARLAQMGIQNPPATLRLTCYDGGQGAATVLKECEKKVNRGDVLVIDTSFSGFGDQPKRMAMKTGCEVFVTAQAPRCSPLETALSKVKKRMAHQSDAIYWSEGVGVAFRVLKHRSKGGGRILPAPYQP